MLARALPLPGQGHYWEAAAQQVLDEQAPDAACPVGASLHVHAHAHAHTGGCHTHHTAIIDALLSRDKLEAAQQAAAAVHRTLCEAEEGTAGGGAAAAHDSCACTGGACCDELAVPLLGEQHHGQHDHGQHPEHGQHVHGEPHGEQHSGHAHGHGSGSGGSSQAAQHHDAHCSAVSLQKDASQIVGLYLTEAGIIFHSGAH